ncbi:MAG: hypothetical protein PHI98_16405 [Eubacteriales bacterium]|nr:hypothetical protein [Eubacteriales bacterium]
MKKAMAILLALMLLVGSGAAVAEPYHFVEDSSDFDIQMELPEGATLDNHMGLNGLSLVSVSKEGLATVNITIAASELYDKDCLNDLSESDVNDLAELAASQYDAPEITIETTPSNNKYVHICANADYDVDSIFTLYMGYFIEMTQWHEDYSSITDEDYAFMEQLLYNLEFIPVEK